MKKAESPKNDIKKDQVTEKKDLKDVRGGKHG